MKKEIINELEFILWDFVYPLEGGVNIQWLKCIDGKPTHSSGEIEIPLGVLKQFYERFAVQTKKGDYQQNMYQDLARILK